MAKTEEIQASVKSVKNALKDLGVSNKTKFGFTAHFVLDTLYGGLQEIGINHDQQVELEEELEEHENLGNKCGAKVTEIVTRVNELLELVDKEDSDRVIDEIDDICGEINNVGRQVSNVRGNIDEAIGKFSRFWGNSNPASNFMRSRDEIYDETEEDLTDVRDELTKLKSELSSK